MSEVPRGSSVVVRLQVERGTRVLGVCWANGQSTFAEAGGLITMPFVA
jgi:hypothetical protein